MRHASPSVIHLVLAGNLLWLSALFLNTCYHLFLLVGNKTFTSVFSCSLLMVSATGTMFQVDCDYQNECSGTNLGLQRIWWAHFSRLSHSVKCFSQNVQWFSKYSVLRFFLKNMTFRRTFRNKPPDHARVFLALGVKEISNYTGSNICNILIGHPKYY